MGQLRDLILELPFTRDNGDGTFTYWSVESTGDDAADMRLGRLYGALTVHFVARHGCPGMLSRLSASAERAGARSTHIYYGFLLEVYLAAMDAPAGSHASLDAAAATLSIPVDPMRGLNSLPFVEVSPDAGLDAWTVSDSGDYSDDNWRGRFYAGCIVRYLQLTGDLGLGRFVAASQRAKADAGEVSDNIRIGFVTALAEIASEGTLVATALQREIPTRKEFAALLV